MKHYPITQYNIGYWGENFQTPLKNFKVDVLSCHNFFSIFWEKDTIDKWKHALIELTMFLTKVQEISIQ